MLLKDKIADKAWELYKMSLESQLQQAMADGETDEEVCSNCALAFAELHTSAFVANETVLLDAIWRHMNEAKNRKEKEKKNAG